MDYESQINLSRKVSARRRAIDQVSPLPIPQADLFHIDFGQRPVPYPLRRRIRARWFLYGSSTKLYEITAVLIRVWLHL